MIDKNFIKENVKISSVLSAQGYKLTQVGTHQFKTYCLNPEHLDNNPSLQISDSKKWFKCFSCGIGGDVIELVKYIKADIKYFPAQLEYLNQFIGDNMGNSFLLNGKQKIINIQDEKDFKDIMNYIANYWSLQLTKEIKDKYILNNEIISYGAFKGEIINMQGYGLTEDIVKELNMRI